MASAPLLTTEDYLRTPESLLPAELIYGALRVVEAPVLAFFAFQRSSASGPFFPASFGSV